MPPRKDKKKIDYGYHGSVVSVEDRTWLWEVPQFMSIGSNVSISSPSFKLGKYTFYIRIPPSDKVPIFFHVTNSLSHWTCFMFLKISIVNKLDNSKSICWEGASRLGSNHHSHTLNLLVLIILGFGLRLSINI